jgi:hypothetical protein
MKQLEDDIKNQVRAFGSPKKPASISEHSSDEEVAVRRKSHSPLKDNPYEEALE